MHHFVFSAEFCLLLNALGSNYKPQNENLL